MKKVISILMIFCLLASVLSVGASDNKEIITYDCYSNLSTDLKQIRILSCGSDAYISTTDLATVSGFVTKDNVSFSRTGAIKNEDFIVAYVDTNHVTLDNVISFEGENWAPLEASCEKLLTSVSCDGYQLIFRGKVTTPEELLAMTDEWILETSVARILDTHSFEGNLALVGSFVMDMALDWSQVLKKISGSYTLEIYDEIFKDLISDSIDSESILGGISKVNSIIKAIAEGDIEADGNDPEELSKLLTKYGLSDDAVEAYKVTSLIDTLLDPIDSVYEKIVKSETFKDTFLSDVKLDGFDIATQLSLYSYLDTIINTSDTYVNMLKYTYYSPETGCLYDGINDNAAEEVYKITKYHYSTSRYDTFCLCFTEELKKIAIETTFSSLSDLLFEMIEDSEAGFVKLVQLTYKLLFSCEAIWGVDVIKASEFSHKSRVLEDTQVYVKKLYEGYRNVDTAINAKYSAMMYLRCAELYTNYLNECYGESATTTYANKIAILKNVSDYDMTSEVKNEKIDFSEIENSKETTPTSQQENVDVEVGDTITFGAYEQDNDTSNGKEAIEWRVLAIEGNKALLISEYALDCKQYNTSDTDVTWETCTLRTWLNGTFLNAAFSTGEQANIQSSKVTAEDNPEYGTDAGNDTIDKVFLLSISEANKYFSSDEDRKCAPTAYAIAQGASRYGYYTKGGKATCWWLLRSRGPHTYFHFCVSLVDCFGSVHNFGHYVDYDDDGVRPALWINLES